MHPIVEHMLQLLAIGKKAEVLIQFFDTTLELGHDWDGLYLVCSERGPGIAVNSSLPIEWQVWVLAHELGHHFDALSANIR